MKKKKNNKFKFLIIIIILFNLCIGFAVISRTLNVTGNSLIKQNTWDLHFENVKITSGSVTATKNPIIDNTNLSLDFSVVLNLPGDFYEFTVDIKNAGTIDAMIDGIVKTPELTVSQAKYLKYIIEYENEEQISLNQLVKAKQLVRLKIRVEYRTDITEFDLPTVTETLNLGFSVNYVQADYNIGILVKNNGVNVKATANWSLDEVGTIVTIGDQQFYTIGTEGNNVKLLAMHNLYVGNEVTYDEENEEFLVNQIENTTGLQNPEAKGANVDENFQYLFPWIGTIEFSSEQQDEIEYRGSIVESYVNDYKDLLINNYGVNIEEARLITRSELTGEDIGCTEKAIGDTDVEIMCTHTYDWLYSSSYWIDFQKASNVQWGMLVVGLPFYDLYDNNSLFGVRPVIVMPKSEIDVSISDKPVALGDVNEIGTIVTIGTEKFYTYGTEGDNVKLLAMYNLNVGNMVTSIDDNVQAVKFQIENPTGMQSFKAKGAVVSKNLEYFLPWIGTVAFSSEEHYEQNKAVYNGSYLEGYVNNYKNLLENNFDVEVEEARIITIEELLSESIGCTRRVYESSDVEIICVNAPEFIYSTSYWLDYDSDSLYGIFTFGGAQYMYYDMDEFLGVRPVIIISKSYFQ